MLLVVRDGANFTVQLVVVYEIILVCRKQLSFLSFRVDVKKNISIGNYSRLYNTVCKIDIMCTVFASKYFDFNETLFLEPVPFKNSIL